MTLVEELRKEGKWQNEKPAHAHLGVLMIEAADRIEDMEKCASQKSKIYRAMKSENAELKKQLAEAHEYLKTAMCELDFASDALKDISPYCAENKEKVAGRIRRYLEAIRAGIVKENDNV